MTTCALMRAAATTVVVLATTSATGAYAVAAAGTGQLARGRTPVVTSGALTGVLGPALASLSVPEIRARITAAIDRQVERVATLAAAVGTSERLDIEQRARAAERLGRARADLADLRAEVGDQTSPEGLARVLAEAHRHRVFWRNWTLERVPGSHRAAQRRAVSPKGAPSSGDRGRRALAAQARPGAA